MAQTTQTRKIVVSVDTSSAAGLKDLAAQFGLMNQSTKELQKTFQGLTASAGGFLLGLGLKQIADFSDEIQTLNNRLVNLTGDQDDATDLLAQLAQAARDTNIPLQSLGDAFIRYSQATARAGISTDALLSFTETLANTFRLSGASAEEAATGLSQLTRVFQLGAISGRDLRSIISQNTVLAGLLQQKFGKNLLKDAEQGILTLPGLLTVLKDNMDDVNTRAGAMAATFGQTTTKALDAFKLAIFGVTSSIDAQSAYAVAVQFAIDNMNILLSVVTILSVSALPALASKFISFASTIGILNPIGLAIAGIVTILLAVEPAADKALSATDRLGRSFTALALNAVTLVSVINEFPALFGSQARVFTTSSQGLDNLEKSLSGVLAQYDQLAAATSKDKAAGDIGKSAADQAKELQKAIIQAGSITPDLSGKNQFAALNKAFLNTGDIDAYNAALQKVQLYKLNDDFKNGTIDIFQYNTRLREINLESVNTEFTKGLITLTDYNEQLEKVNTDKLVEELQAGKISLTQFSQELVKVENGLDFKNASIAGVSEFLTSIGTVSSNIADAVKDTFSSLETSLETFIKNGTFSFQNFTQGILDDLTKIIIRATIIRPLANGILGLLPGAGGTAATSAGGDEIGTYANVAAKGMAFDTGGIRKFAQGGIVNSPTPFKYGSGSNGLMGEAGPEAIVPLQRGSGGKLGIAAQQSPPVQINIINNNQSNITQKQTTGPSGEKVISVIIDQQVRTGIASGKYDTAFNQSFGVTRKGS